ncbi:hypothetical protein IG631_24329 [Alternaria alternata]|nr:hypothetical protein IG631_24329 [Alternaria alternata]
MEFWRGAPPRSAQTRPTTTAETAARCAPIPSNPPARSGEAISAVVYFLPDYKVIVCKQYVTAIQNPDADAHLCLRKQIADSYSTILVRLHIVEATRLFVRNKRERLRPPGAGAT